jgi:hypothetical protein
MSFWSEAKNPGCFSSAHQALALACARLRLRHYLELAAIAHLRVIII